MAVSLSLTASIALWAVGCLPSRDHRPHGVRFEALRAKSAETIDGNVVARAAYIDDHFGDPHVGGRVSVSRPVLSWSTGCREGCWSCDSTRLLSRFAEVVY